MLTHITDGQLVADALKRYVLGAPVPGAFQRVVIRTVSEFETVDWIPGYFDDALQAETRLRISDALSVSFDGEAGEALSAIDAALRTYISVVRQGEKTLTPSEAAEYLGISIEMFNTYSVRQKRIPSEKKGNTRVFRRADLDRFNREDRRGRGKPREEPVSE